MKKIIFIFLFIPSILFSQWYPQTVPSDIDLLLSVSFFGVNNGISGGWRNLSGINGRVIYTTNSGTSWVLAQIPDSSRSLVKVQLVNSITGYIAGACNTFFETDKTGSFENNLPILNNWQKKYYKEIGLISNGTHYKGMFLKTTNSGIVWNTYGQLPQNVYYLNGIKFLNINSGFVCAELNPSGGILSGLLKTTNGGNSWTTIYTIDTADINNIFTNDGNNIFAAGQQRYYGNMSSGFILKSTNGGVNWSKSVFQTASVFNDINFINATTGFAVGWDTLGNGLIYKTINSGTTWSMINVSLNNNFLYGVSFVPGTGTGIVYGSVGLDSVLIAKTTDFGINWTRVVFSQSGFFHDCSFSDANIWHICGGVYQGIMYKTTNGGNPIGIQPISLEIPQSFSLSQNYPNPFNPTTAIKFDIPKAGNVSLKIYDILGKEVYSINEFKSTGQYEFTFDATNYASRLYFYKLESGSFSETKKMILTK